MEYTVLDWFVWTNQLQKVFGGLLGNLKLYWMLDKILLRWKVRNNLLKKGYKTACTVWSNLVKNSIIIYMHDKELRIVISGW